MNVMKNLSIHREHGIVNLSIIYVSIDLCFSLLKFYTIMFMGAHNGIKTVETITPKNHQVLWG